MTRTGLLAVAALATAVILVPTGAVPFDLTGTDPVSEELVLQPAEGANGNYALVNENDELELLLTDANPATDGESIGANAVTPVHGVFTMTYTGDRSARVWLTDDAADVRFYRGDDSVDSIEGRANSVVLGPSEAVTVGLLVDTRGDHDVEQAETFTVHAEIAEEDTDDEVDTPQSTPESTPEDTPQQSTESRPDGGGPNDGDGARATPTPTPESGDGPTEVAESTPLAGSGDESGAGQLTETPTPTPTSVDNGSDDTGVVELGGGAIGAVLALLAALLALLVAIAGYRRYRQAS